MKMNTIQFLKEVGHSEQGHLQMTMAFVTNINSIHVYKPHSI